MTKRETVARVRLLSQARQGKYGPMPEDPSVWWQQIERIAAELDLPITFAEWDSVSVKQIKQDVD
jgi:hypothetical protein